MLDTTTLSGNVIAATLRLAAARPWNDVTLLDIAESAGVPLIDIKSEFSSKTDILAGLAKAVDDEVLRKLPRREGEQSKRDRVFEVIMARFDVLQPHREAIRSIHAGAPFDPALVRTYLASQHWMLQAAGVGTDGLGGCLRVAGLAGIYGQVFQTWLEDDDPGLARTMAALDRRLRRGESTLRSMEGVLDGARRFADALSSGWQGARRPSSTPPGTAGSGPAGEAHTS